VLFLPSQHLQHRRCISGECRPLRQGSRVAELPAQQLVESLGGSGTVFGNLPKEGKLETEDEADESFESEEGSEEESGEGSEE